MKKERFLSALSLTLLLTSLSAVAQQQVPNSALVSSRLINQLPNPVASPAASPAASPDTSPTASPAANLTEEQAITEVIAAGWMSPDSDGNFRAERALSRAELAHILVKAFQLDQRQPSTNQPIQALPLQDLPSSHWAYADIQTVLRQNIMSGYRAGRFFPEQRVTRAEAFSIIAQAYGVFQFPDATITQILQPYSDAPKIPSWARKSLATALYEGFVNLKPNQTIAPLDPMTRGDVAQALEVYLRRQHLPADLPPQSDSP